MVCRTSSTKRPHRATRAFALTESLIAAGLLGIFSLTVCALTLYSTRTCQALLNYVGLNADDRIAVDYLSRDIREAKKVTAYTTNSLTLQASDLTSLTYTYDPVNRTFSRTKDGVSKVLLTDCDELKFDLGERNPVGGSYDVYPAATFDTAKVIDVRWVCSRKILGIRANTESVQTARIVIRKQGT